MSTAQSFGLGLRTGRPLRAVRVRPSPAPRKRAAITCVAGSAGGREGVVIPRTC
jgi:hypothetical protein